MGERLNCVIVDDGTTELYYASWGGLDLDLDLVAGPEVALHRIRRRYRPTDDLLDSIWCEAAVLVDLPRRVLAWFSWRCGGYANRAALHALLAETWPGWKLRWAYGGIDELAAYAGRPVPPVRRSDFPARSRPMSTSATCW